jgi:hypothetical protein
MNDEQLLAGTVGNLRSRATCWEIAEADMKRKVIAVVLLISAMWARSACAQDATFAKESGKQQTWTQQSDEQQGGHQDKAAEQNQAKTIINQDQAGAARAAAGCGPNEIQFDVKTDKTQHPLTPADAARAVIYVFSERAEFPNVRIGMDGKWMGANHDDSYFFFTAGPGEHRLCWDTQKGQGAAVTFTAEAGKAYFFKTTLRGNNEIAPRRKFERLDAAEGMFLVSSSPLSTSRPKAQKAD